MKEKRTAPKGKPNREPKGQSRQNPPARTEGKPLSSGITQPHNAKKEALGPNTNR